MLTDTKESMLIELIDTLTDPKYSSTEENLHKSLDCLLKIYTDDFRHSYSQIFYKLQNIFSDDFEVSSALGENLNSLEEYIQKQLQSQPDNLNLLNAAKSFRKFSDHINLEIGRYNFIKQQFENSTQIKQTNSSDSSVTSEQFTNLENRVAKQEKNLEKIEPIAITAQSAVDKVDSKLESNKISSITALTIFSAVTLSFSGGISFASSVFDNIGNATPYRLVFIVSLMGFILFNTIFALLYIVAKMTGKTISARCKYLVIGTNNSKPYRACGDGYCTKQCSGVSLSCKIWHKYSYVFAINIVLVCIMYYDYLLWSMLPKRKFVEFTIPEMTPFLLPLILVFVLFLANQISKSIQRKRILLSIKCNAVSRYFNPNTSIFTNLITAISSRLLGSQKNYEQELAEIIEGSSVKRLKKIDLFVEDKLLTPEALSQTITRRQHKQNKALWKTLSGKINEHIPLSE